MLPARARPAARELPPVSALVCTRLARGLLHDLRSPLMAISGFAEVLAFRHAAELGSDARRCVDNIVAATRRLEHMVELLASETRLGAGELEPRPLDLRELLRGLAVEGRAEAFELHLAAGLPLVGGDALVLRGAFAALVALAQGAPAARPARVRIELSCEHERPRVRIDGPGQPSDAPDSAVAAAELALARRALELHGWQLRGTAPRFEVELPAPGGK